jgi:hypothetical protein
MGVWRERQTDRERGGEPVKIDGIDGERGMNFSLSS